MDGATPLGFGVHFHDPGGPTRVNALRVPPRPVNGRIMAGHYSENPQCRTPDYERHP